MRSERPSFQLRLLIKVVPRRGATSLRHRDLPALFIQGKSKAHATVARKASGAYHDQKRASSLASA